MSVVKQQEKPFSNEEIHLKQRNPFETEKKPFSNEEKTILNRGKTRIHFKTHFISLNIRKLADWNERKNKKMN